MMNYLVKALNEIEKYYEPGMVKYFEKQNPDPWQAAFDEFEKGFHLEDELQVKAIAGNFLREIARLRAVYVSLNQASFEFHPTDLPHIEMNACYAADSKKNKSCEVCMNESWLKPFYFEKRIYLVCENCRDERKIKAAMKNRELLAVKEWAEYETARSVKQEAL
jgi:hypothetical protein